MSQKREMEAELIESIEKLHKDYRDFVAPKKRLLREFTGGIIRGLGMAIGGTIVFGILAFVLGKFLIIPGAENLYDRIRHDAVELQEGFSSPPQSP